MTDVLAARPQPHRNIIDARRSLRLEQIIVVLIGLEIVIAGYQILAH
jgi:uncharacterized Rmd1/YagE family protein